MSFKQIHQLLLLFILVVIVSATSHNHHHQHHQQHKPIMSKSLNVFKKPLALHSTSPMTGFLRNGYCEVPASDFGNHSVAAEVTEEFLTFSAKQGNDLRTVGLKGGCKWCLCATRWKEAYEARGREGDKIVPKSVQDDMKSQVSC